MKAILFTRHWGKRKRESSDLETENGNNKITVREKGEGSNTSPSTSGQVRGAVGLNHHFRHEDNLLELSRTRH